MGSHRKVPLCITYISPDNLIYTATLGDSEANIYRIINGSLKSIPLSVIRDFTSDKEVLRVVRFTGELQYLKILPTANPKTLYPTGVNVARALGDKDATGTATNPVVIHKPKITANRILPGDMIILVCDGIKDFMSEKAIVEQIAKCISHKKNPSKHLVNYAIDTANSSDNATVLAIRVH